MTTLERTLNRFLGKRRAPSKPRRSRSGIGAARLRQHPRVEYVDGRDAGFEDWFIYLKPGWRWFGYVGEHAHGFETLREALREVNRAEPCDCEECQREAGK
jgi:hypothetical protein